MLRLSIIEKGSNGLSLQQDWTALIHHGKALLDPKPHGVFMRAKGFGCFVNRVVSMDLNAPRVDATIGHPLQDAPFDQGSDVLDAPRRCARAKLHRLGEAPIFDANPPS